MRDWNSPSSRVMLPFLSVCSLPMRDWNLYSAWRERWTYRVCSLPMRDWNYIKCHCSAWRGVWFVAYLWGIETSGQVLGHDVLFMFVAYLWGIETEDADLAAAVRESVCSLPMRDWNNSLLVSSLPSLTVCSLPMRDWNANIIAHRLHTWKGL